MRLLRFIVPVVPVAALVFAAAVAHADTAAAKGDKDAAVAGSAHPKAKAATQPEGAHAKPKKHHSKAAHLTKKTLPKDDEPKKVESKKIDPSEPPPELTGSLPQAKLATKKSDAKKDAGASPAVTHAKDVAKSPMSKASIGKKEDLAKAKKLLKDSPAKDKKSTLPNAKPVKSSPLPPLDSAPKVGFGKKPQGLKSCLHPSVSFARLGQPNDVMFALTTCAGGTAPGAVENLSVLARPYSVPAAPLMPLSVLSLPGKSSKPSKAFAKPSDEIAPGIKRVDSGMVGRLQAIADHFPGKTITLVSGFRPNSKGSPHATARAFDLRIDGVTNEVLVGFCKTLKDTGCGYYPNSYFVHVDVRGEGAGHVFWIDTSGPGEKPNYVKQWPLPNAPKVDVAGKSDAAKTEVAKTEAGKTEEAKKSALEAEAKALDAISKNVTATTDEATIGTMDEGAPHPTEEP